MEKSNLGRLNEIISILKNSGLLNGITPEKLVITLEKLGPSFIKLGQILSTRVDILPSEYCDALSKLRSDVTPLEYNEIIEILNNNYDNLDEVFSSIDKIPLGSASIAQVHKARLKVNNRNVVIKIKRPNIEKILETDFNLFKKAVKLLHLNKIVKVMDLNEVLDQIYEVSKEETNFIIEANHLIEFKRKNEDNKYIRCPKVYTNLCTNNVIVMEYINGIKINDINLLSNQGYDLVGLANILSKNYIKQAIEDGFFHADPHPDNILVKDENIVYIDLGMMGSISEKNKSLLKECMKDIIVKDYKEVSRILVKMSTPLDEVDYLVLENDVANILEEFADAKLDSINTSKFISQMFIMLRKNHLVLDKDVTMLIRGIGIIEPVLQKLNPEISLITVLMLGTKNNILDIKHLEQKAHKVASDIHSMIEIPKELSTFIKSVNNGETKFKVEMSQSKNHIDKLENLVHELVLGFIDGCLIIATTLVKDVELKKYFFIGAIIISFWLIIKMIYDIIHRGY